MSSTLCKTPKNRLKTPKNRLKTPIFTDFDGLKNMTTCPLILPFLAILPIFSIIFGGHIYYSKAIF